MCLIFKRMRTPVQGWPRRRSALASNCRSVRNAQELEEALRRNWFKKMARKPCAESFFSAF
jgi:hypothetical protein